MNTLRVMIAGALVLVVTAGYADYETPKMGPVSFGAFDGNGDGYVSRDEYNYVHEQRARTRAGDQRQHRNMKQPPDFSTIDTDGDGRLSRAEVDTHRSVRHKAWRMQRMDDITGNGRNAGTGKEGNTGEISR